MIEWTDANEKLMQTHLVNVHNLMYDYQKEAVSSLKARPKAILDCDMGAGKTLLTLTSVFLRRPKRVLILCSKNALYTWEKELVKWFPGFEDYAIVRGTRTQRKKLWESDHLFHASTFAGFRQDLEFINTQEWDFVIGDEYHKAGIRNRRTIMAKAIKAFINAGIFKELKPKTKEIKRRAEFYNSVPYTIILTGTPTSRGAQDLWAPLNILDPRRYSSFWGFIEKFCVVVDGAFGKEISGAQNTKLLRDTIRPNYVRIPRSVTDKQLPKLTRIPINVDMTAKQLKVYKEMDEDMCIMDKDAFILASTSLAQLTRLRQLTSCPKILNIDDYGAGIEAVVDMMSDAEDYHGVIFTTFTGAIPHYIDYLRSRVPKDTPIDYLIGGTEPEEVKERTRRFRRDRGIMVCSIKFSQSFELETARRCWFIAYDCDPNENQQAEGRLRRASGTMEPISAYYIKHMVPGVEQPVDDRWMEILSIKDRTNKATYQDIETSPQ